MSLATLGAHLAEQRDRVSQTQRELAELQELIALWFDGSDCAAREWLVEVARRHRERQVRDRLAIQQNAQQVATQ